jgi:hypothetical protein
MTGGENLYPYYVDRGAYAPFPGQPTYLGRHKSNDLDFIAYNFLDKENMLVYTYGSAKSDRFYNYYGDIDKFLLAQIKGKKAAILYKNVGRLEEDSDKLGAYVRLRYYQEDLEVVQHIKIILSDHVIHQWSIQDASGGSGYKSKAIFSANSAKFTVK